MPKKNNQSSGTGKPKIKQKSYAAVPNAHQETHTVHASRFSGPVPPPEILHGYEQTLPGAADRILTLAEGEAQHRRTMERKIIIRDANERMAGLCFGLLVAFAGIGGGVWCIINGHPVSGTVLGGGTIVSLVGVFVYGSRMKNSDSPLAEENPE